MAKTKYRRELVETSGYRYNRTGDLSGDLCSKCGSFMILEKRMREVKDRFDRKSKKIVWTLICQDCRREVPYISNTYDMSAYK